MRAAVNAISLNVPSNNTFLRRSAVLLAGVLSAALVSPVAAADYPSTSDYLRGSYVAQPRYYQWDGFYGGGQIGVTSTDVKFDNATQPLTDYILRNSVIQDNVAGWATLPNGATTSNNFGGFIGYNWQWDDIVIGLEGNYSRMSATKAASDSLSRQFIDNAGGLPDHTYTYAMTVAGASTVKLTDLATFRARAGWAVGTLLPYGFVGFAVARADVTTTASVSGTVTVTCNDPADPGCNPSGPDPINLPGPQTTSRKGVFTYGGSIGLGFDWALSQNLFVRGEWELVQLQAVEGVDLRINTARAAVGLKF